MSTSVELLALPGPQVPQQCSAGPRSFRVEYRGIDEYSAVVAQCAHGAILQPSANEKYLELYRYAGFAVHLVVANDVHSKQSQEDIALD